MKNIFSLFVLVSLAYSTANAGWNWGWTGASGFVGIGCSATIKGRVIHIILKDITDRYATLNITDLDNQDTPPFLRTGNSSNLGTYVSSSGSIDDYRVVAVTVQNAAGQPTNVPSAAAKGYFSVPSRSINNVPLICHDGKNAFR